MVKAIPGDTRGRCPYTHAGGCAEVKGYERSQDLIESIGVSCFEPAVSGRGQSKVWMLKTYERSRNVHENKGWAIAQVVPQRGY